MQVKAALFPGRAFIAAATATRVAHRLFAFSICYLFLLFAALLADHGGDLLSSKPSSHGAGTGAGLIQTQFLPSPVPTFGSPTNVRAAEV